MPTWLQEFLIVTDASLRLQIALFSIPVVPSLIVLFGTLLLNSVRDVPGPLMPLLASMSESLFCVYLVLAAFSCIGCMAIAAKEYRRAYKRFFG